MQSESTEHISILSVNQFSTHSEFVQSKLFRIFNDYAWVAFSIVDAPIQVSLRYEYR